jgi:phage-related protein
MMAGPEMSIEALDRDGRCEVRSLIAEFPPRSRKKLDAVFARLAEYGRTGPESTSFKRLSGVVHEVKEHSANVRIFCFVWQHRLVVCTHGARKPAGKARYRVEIDRVLRLYEECLQEGVLV